MIGDSCSRCERVDNSTSSGIELSCVRVAIDTSPTQLNSTRRQVELSCVAINTPLSASSTRRFCHSFNCSWIYFVNIIPTNKNIATAIRNWTASCWTLRERDVMGDSLSYHLQGALKMREWKMQEWKMREHIAGVENAGVENSGVDRRGGKCRS